MKRNLGAWSLIALAVPFTAAHAQTTQPRVLQSDITYLGSFALPSWANGKTYGASFFEYGGHGLTFYKDASSGKDTLFMEGHAQTPGAIAQVEIPTSFGSGSWSSLPSAKILQNFISLGSSPDSGSCTGNPSFVYGMFPYNGKLIVADACSYGGAQTTSHGIRSLNLSTGGFQGWYGFTGADASPRALAGPMLQIPTEWQSLFGGPAFTGQCCISVTGSTSAGPSLTVFNPADVGVRTPIPGKTVLFYPLTHPACGAEHCEAKQSDVYNLTTVYGGAAFPSGTSSVLFVVAHGTGPYCYGSASDCGNDSDLPDVKGPHAQPYRYQILAYDANDLLAVKKGTKQSYDPKPYAVLQLNGMPNSSNDKIKGAAFDQATGRLYIAQDYGDQPRIEVYQIGTPGPQVPIITPSPATNVKTS